MIEGVIKYSQEKYSVKVDILLKHCACDNKNQLGRLDRTSLKRPFVNVYRRKCSLNAVF